MKDLKFATAYLKATEKKHHDYFVSNHLSIMNCVEIEGQNDVCIHVTKDDLPPAIRYDIEVMFWRTSYPTDLSNTKRKPALL